MSWTLAQVKARVRNLLDDPQGSYLTDDFIVPLINEVYSDANSQLTSTQSSFDINVVEVPGITPGTPNMAAFSSRAVPSLTLLLSRCASTGRLRGTIPSYYQLVHQLWRVARLAAATRHGRVGIPRKRDLADAKLDCGRSADSWRVWLSAALRR